MGLAICAAVVPLYTVHENLTAAKNRKIEKLMLDRRSAVGDQRLVLEKEVREIVTFGDWVFGTTGGILVVSWQVLLLVCSTAVESFQTIGIKRLFRSDDKETKFPKSGEVVSE